MILKRISALIIIAIMVMWSAPAFAIDAANDWTNCNATLNGPVNSTTPSKVRGKQPRCFEFNDVYADAAIFFDVSASKAKVCLLTDTESATVGDVRGSLYPCNRGLAHTTSSCSSAATIKAYTTDECFAVTNGVYRFDITTGVTDGEVAIVYVQPY